jgi:hypothetical protein
MRVNAVSLVLGRREVLVAGVIGVGALLMPSLTRASSVYPLKPTRGDRLLIAARVNGNDVEALLDSAAEASFLDLAFARRIGLAGTESVTAKGSGEKNFGVSFAKGVTLNAAGLTL